METTTFVHCYVCIHSVDQACNQFTAWGFFLTILGTLLAALKTIVTNLIQVGRLKLHPLDLLMRMAPLAFVQCVIYSYASGELERVREYGALEMDRSRVVALLLNACNSRFDCLTFKLTYTYRA